MGNEDIVGTGEAIVALLGALVVLLLRWRWERARVVGSSLAVLGVVLGAVSIADYLGFQYPHVFAIALSTAVGMCGLAWLVNSRPADRRRPSVSPRHVSLLAAAAGITCAGYAIALGFDGTRIVIAGLMAANLALVLSLARPDAQGDDR